MKKSEIQKLIKDGTLDINYLSKLIEEEKENYVSKKVDEYVKEGFSKSEAINKANQSWRTYIGNHLQDLIVDILKTYFENKDVKIIKDTNLKGSKLSPELDLVKRMLLIHYENYSFLPDADIILYKGNKEKVKIICVISVKNSFRERGFETTYWKLKLLENPNTKDIKMFLATPDKDNEISTIETKTGAKKMRVILEYELDGIYMLKSDFQKTQKVKNFKEIFDDIEKLINEVKP